MMQEPWDSVPVARRSRSAKKAASDADPWADVPVVQPREPTVDVGPAIMEGADQGSGTRLDDQGRAYTVASRQDTTETPEELTAQGYQQDSNGTWYKMHSSQEFTSAGEAAKPELSQRLGAWARATTEMIPFMDEGVAKIVSLQKGIPYDDVRQVQQGQVAYDKENRAGSRFAGQATGFGASLAAPGSGYIRGAQGLGAVARAGQVGAGYGALYGLGAGEGSLADRAPGGVMGAVTGGVAGAGLQAGASAASRVMGISGVGRQSVPSPTLETLRGAKNAAYRDVDNSGAVYSGEQIKGLGRQIKVALTDLQIDPDLHPAASKMLRNIQKRGDDMTLTQVDQLRQVIRRDVVSGRAEGEQLMGQEMIQKLDDFLDASAPATGPEGAGGLVTRARDLNTRVRKIEDINDAMEAATLQAGPSGSGGNINNAIRQKMKVVLTRRNNFTPEERTALREIVLGTRGQNLLRLAGKFSPEGNGLMAVLQTGMGVASNGATLPLAVGGAVAKRVADRQTITAVERLIAQIARGAEGVEVADQSAAQALLKLKGAGAQDADSLSVYRAAIARLAAQAVAGNDNAIRPLSAAAAPEEPLQ